VLIPLLFKSGIEITVEAVVCGSQLNLFVFSSAPEVTVSGKAAIVLWLKAIHPSILESQGSYNFIDQFSSKCVRHGGIVRSSIGGGG
jgi:hypothetical protein